MHYHFDVSNNLEGGGGAKYIKLCFILIFISIISLSENGGVPYHLKGFHIFWILGRLCFFNWHVNLALFITTSYYVFWCFFQIWWKIFYKNSSKPPIKSWEFILIPYLFLSIFYLYTIITNLMNMQFIYSVSIKAFVIDIIY